MTNLRKENIKTIIILVLVIIGLVVTVDLAYIYYQANFNNFALPSFCNVNEFIDCDGVARTSESQFFGVPLAYWGLFLYSFILMLLGVDTLKKVPFLKFLEVFKNKFHYIASLGLIAFVISMCLLMVSLFGIHKLCLMCAVTYVLDLVIGLVAASGIEGHFIGTIKQSFVDFIDALKPVPYRIAFIIVLICASIFLGWSYGTAKFSPALKRDKDFGEFLHAKYNKYAVKGNVLGSKDKDAVVLKVYSDFNCPMCFVGNIMVHKIAADFSNVRVEHHNLPLDQDCNKYLEQPFHVGSCIMARYSKAAEEQGKFWDVESLLFEKKPSGEDEIVEVLKESGLGLDMDKLQEDANKEETLQSILTDIDYAQARGIYGTPSMLMGDDFEMGIEGYPKLREWVIKHGGKPKNKLFK